MRGKVWLAFSAIFFVLCLFHSYSAFQNAPDFVPDVRPGSATGRIVILGMDVDQPLRDFAASFNNYVHQQNASARFQNIASALGYLLAFVTAVMSYFESQRPIAQNPALDAKRDQEWD